MVWLLRHYALLTPPASLRLSGMASSKPPPARKGAATNRSFYEDDQGRRFSITTVFGEIDGRYELISLKVDTAELDANTNEVRPLPWPGIYNDEPDQIDEHGRYWHDHQVAKPPFGLIAEDLRQVIPWGGIVGDLRRRHGRNTEQLRAAGISIDLEEEDRWRGGSPSERLKRAAGIYRQAVKLGDNPVNAVMRDLDIKSKSTAAKIVVRARKAGYLGPAKPGRAGEVHA